MPPQWMWWTTRRCARLADLGVQFPPREKDTPEALGAFQKAEIKKWWPIIKEFGIKAEWARGGGRVAWLRSRSRPVAIDDAIIAGCCSWACPRLTNDNWRARSGRDYSRAMLAGGVEMRVVLQILAMIAAIIVAAVATYFIVTSLLQFF
jgi:hypothetical protein